MAVRRFTVSQRQTLLQNRYEVRSADGTLIAFAQQKRLALRESISLWRDERQAELVLQLKADRVLDLGVVMVVRDPVGHEVGRLAKRAGASLVRSTWELHQPGRAPVVVQERSVAVAVLRRVWGLLPFLSSVPVPWVFHFDGTAPDGQVVLRHSRRWGLRDRYDLEVLDDDLDARLAIALAVVLDALQSR